MKDRRGGLVATHDNDRRLGMGKENFVRSEPSRLVTLLTRDALVEEEGLELGWAELGAVRSRTGSSEMSGNASGVGFSISSAILVVTHSVTRGIDAVHLISTFL